MSDCYEIHRDDTGKMTGFKYYHRELRMDDRVICAGYCDLVPYGTRGKVVGFKEPHEDNNIDIIVSVQWENRSHPYPMKIPELLFLDQIPIDKYISTYAVH